MASVGLRNFCGWTKIADRTGDEAFFAFFDQFFLSTVDGAFTCYNYGYEFMVCPIWHVEKSEWNG
jgi:hypothetical protein